MTEQCANALGNHSHRLNKEELAQCSGMTDADEAHGLYANWGTCNTHPSAFATQLDGNDVAKDNVTRGLTTECQPSNRSMSITG